MARKAVAIDSSRNASDVGIIAKGGGIAVTDVPFKQVGDDEPQICSSLHIGMGGDVVYEGVDGKPDVFRNVGNDRILPVMATRILSSAVLNDTNTYTTTASQITWHGRN